MTHHLDHNNLPEIVRKVVSATFPNYTGRKFKVETGTTFHNDQSWSGGSRTQKVLVSRDGHILRPDADSGNPFKTVCHQTFDIPPNHFLVKHTISCGHDLGITIVIRPDEFNTGILPETPSLIREEKIVLSATRSLKSSYAGVKNFRFHEAERTTGITWDQWREALQSCIDRRLLTKGKAITPAGRNAIGNTALRTLKSEA